MLNTPARAARHVLLRLPEDLAQQLARAVPLRQRHRFVLQVLEQALAQHKPPPFLQQQPVQQRDMQLAAEQLNALEAQHPEWARETDDWLQAPLAQPLQQAAQLAQAREPRVG